MCVLELIQACGLRKSERYDGLEMNIQILLSLITSLLSDTDAEFLFGITVVLFGDECSAT
jgi:hypothetical protein